MADEITAADIAKLATTLEVASSAVSALQKSVQENAIRQEGINTKLDSIESTVNSLRETVSGSDQSLLSRVAVIESKHSDNQKQLNELKVSVQRLADKSVEDERTGKSNTISILAIVVSTIIGIGSLFVALSTSNCGVLPSAKTPPPASSTK